MLLRGATVTSRKMAKKKCGLVMLYGKWLWFSVPYLIEHVNTFVFFCIHLLVMNNSVILDIIYSRYMKNIPEKYNYEHEFLEMKS